MRDQPPRLAQIEERVTDADLHDRHVARRLHVDWEELDPCVRDTIESLNEQLDDTYRVHAERMAEYRSALEDAFATIADLQFQLKQVRDAMRREGAC